MTNYTVRYRDSAGRMVQREFAAENKQGVFEALAREGISAISVVEGTGAGDSVAKARRNSLMRGAVAGVAVVALAVAAWFAVGRRTAPSGQDAPEDRSATISEVKKAPSWHSPSAPTNSAPRARSKPKTVAAALENMGDSRIDAAAVEVVKEVAENIVKTAPSKRAFRSGVEQLMSWVFTTELGDMPTPVPPIPESEKKNIASILISKNNIEEDDSERLKDAKQTVDSVKRELAKFIGEGGDPDEFLQYYSRQLRDAFEYRQEAIRQSQELADEDPALADEFISKVNERLESEGIKKISKEDVL